MSANCASCYKCKPIFRQKAFNVTLTNPSQMVIALAGNPNVGKSTVFNALTGLRQYTGNWPGKTVTQAQGEFAFQGQSFLLVDLPGTYSLLAASVDEQVARDFILFGHPHVTVVVLDATCLERNLNLALQVLEITDKAVVCLNLVDEAERKGITVDAKALEKAIGVPVVPTAAREKRGLEELQATILRMSRGEIQTKPCQISYSPEVETAIEQIISQLDSMVAERINPRWLALRLLDGDITTLQTIENYLYAEKNDEFPSQTFGEKAIVS